jgi:hypothetical protein
MCPLIPNLRDQKNDPSSYPDRRSSSQPSALTSRRIFLLSPANASGVRARLVLGDSGRTELAQRLRNEGAPLGEVFSFISGLYFRGKLTYARAYANPPWVAVVFS